MSHGSEPSGPMPEEEFNLGEQVRVKEDCPHTLPSWARMLTGTVLGPVEDGFLEVEFGEGRTFPIHPQYLIRVNS